MAQAEDQTLEGLFEKLDKYIQNENHKKALKTVDEIFKLSPKDEDAQRVQIAALMQLGEWENALAAIGSSGLAPSLAFEKAYCQYKLGKVEEGLSTLSPLLSQASSGAADAQPAVELAAQIHYRQGRSQQCLQLFNTLLKQYKVESVEVKTNVLAAYVAAGLSAELSSLMSAMKVTTDRSFELGYNRACGLVAEGDWQAAESELRRAIKRGRETLFGEGCTEEEVEEELAPLTVQLAYVLGRQGRMAEAQELYDPVLRSQSELEDAPSRAVAVNNSFADSGRIDGLPAHKKTVAGAAKKLESLLQDATKPGQLTFLGELESRLSAGQKQLLTLNRCLVYLLSGRLPPAKELAAQLLAAPAGQPDGPPPHLLPLLQAALLSKEGKASEADAHLEQFASAHPAAALEPTLARAQLALEGGDVARAAQLLGAASAAVQGPPQGGLVATHASLLTQVNDTAGAEGVLRAALGSLQKASPAAVGWCLETLLGLQLQLGKQQEALSTYLQLQQATGGNSAMATGLLAKLLTTLASAGTPLPASTWASLTKGLPNITADVRRVVPDVEALEASCVAASKPPVPASQLQQGQSDMEVDAQGAQQEGSKAQPGHKKRSKKRKRLPKGYNPELPNGGLPPPDPERWLPKWQRSDHKKKKLKSSAREKGAVKGSQGAGKVDENLDRTKAESSKQGGKGGGSKPTLPPQKKKGRK